ncbi:hypothetical protein ACFVGY_06900 [Streptomyces sp. NPDC127106]|uniref:hypothetical protein n=1 Tax=Streptomyces sp. NPDC127106 TaxID=3345360 RepID=UPI0036261BC6
MNTSPGLKARRARFILAGGAVAVAALLVAGGFTAATLMNGDPKGQPQASASPAVTGTTSFGSTGSQDDLMTPEKGEKIVLPKPTDHKNSVAVGFPRYPGGGISAVVYFWEEYAWLDDEKASQQLNAVVSKDAPGYADKQVSEIRKMREAIGLAPSGGIPADITFTTSVHAARGKTLKAPGVPVGDIMQVWLSYDRFATGPKGGRDENPLRGETIAFVVKWEDGAWKFTDKYDSMGDYPLAYEATSPYAWSDGWVQVRHAG